MPHACPPLCTGASRGQRRARVRLGSSRENAAAPAPALNLSRRDGNAVSSRSPTGLFYAHQFCLRLLPGQPTAGSRPMEGLQQPPSASVGRDRRYPCAGNLRSAAVTSHLMSSNFRKIFLLVHQFGNTPLGGIFPPPQLPISLYGEKPSTGALGV